MAVIRARSGKLSVDFYYMSMRCRETTFLPDTPANQKKLKKIVETMEAEITLGTFDYSKYFPKSPRAAEMTALRSKALSLSTNVPTFSEFSRVWLAEKEIEWRTSYRRKVHTTVNNYLRPYFGFKLINSITKADLLAFRASLAKVKYGKNQESLSVTRINQIMIPLRMILKEASERYGFETPFQNINNLKETKADVMPFKLDEVWLIINSVRTDFRNYYLVRFFTGMRTSEIDGLKWKNIDFERREIKIREALVDGEMGGTKTRESNREIQMSHLVYEALRKQFEVTGAKSEYVFCNRDGDPLEYRNVNRRVWHPTLYLLGLTPRRAYQTRHTAATLWLAAGENPEWIARQLGHSTTEMLFRVYSRYVPDITRKDGSAFELLIEKSKFQSSQGETV
ncbi:MAG: site-specific integrase [Gammaproteobacteria bacterium]|nr:site-specific integrase [Gammaproteobacteria bacterium]